MTGTSTISTNTGISSSNSETAKLCIKLDKGVSSYIDSKLDYTFNGSDAVSIDLKLKNGSLTVSRGTNLIVFNQSRFAVWLQLIEPGKIDKDISLAAVEGTAEPEKKSIWFPQTAQLKVIKETDVAVNTEISFLVYADKGTKLYKNGGEDPYFSFKVDDGFVSVSLKKNDYLSVTTTTNKIEVENTNDFDLDIEKRSSDVTSNSHLRAKEKKIYLKMMESDKIFVSEKNKKPFDSEIRMSIQLDKGVSLYRGHTPNTNQASEPEYTFKGGDLFCVTCKLNDDYFTVSKDSNLAVENQGRFAIQLQLKEPGKKEGKDTSEFSIAPNEGKKGIWFPKIAELRVNNANPKHKSDNIHIDTTILKGVSSPSTSTRPDSSFQFRVYITIPSLDPHETPDLKLIHTIVSNADWPRSETWVPGLNIEYAIDGNEGDSYRLDYSIRPPPPEDAISTQQPIKSRRVIYLLIRSRDKLFLPYDGFSQNRAPLSRDEILKENEIASIAHKDTRINDFINSDSKVNYHFLYFELGLDVGATETIDFNLSKNLYKKISVLNLTRYNNRYEFYIERYDINIAQTSISQFKNIIEKAGSRGKDANNNHRDNHISKIAFSFYNSFYRGSNLWDIMYDSDSLLQADSAASFKTFGYFDFIMRNNAMPEVDNKPGVVKMVFNIYNNNTGMKEPKILAARPDEIFKYYDVNSSTLLGARELESLIKKDVFALCLWECKKPFVTSRQDTKSQFVRLRIKVNLGKIAFYKNHKLEYSLHGGDAPIILNLEKNGDYAIALEESTIDLDNQNDFAVKLKFTLKENIYEPWILSQDKLEGIKFLKGEKLVIAD